MPPGKRKSKFNPEGRGYDFDGAHKAGLKPDKTGHWPSRDPESGKLLKGKSHPTWNKTVAAEKRYGYKIYKRNGRYYSKKTNKGK